MLHIKPILCSGICILFFTAVTGQTLLQKNKPIGDVIDQDNFQQKLCSVKQVLKESVSFEYETDLHHNSYLTISPLSTISISFTDCSAAPPDDPSVSEKLQSHLQKNLFEPYKYFFTTNSCWDPNFFKRYKTITSNKSFFTYQ